MFWKLDWRTFLYMKAWARHGTTPLFPPVFSPASLGLLTTFKNSGGDPSLNRTLFCLLSFHPCAVLITDAQRCSKHPLTLHTRHSDPQSLWPGRQRLQGRGWKKNVAKNNRCWKRLIQTAISCNWISLVGWWSGKWGRAYNILTFNLPNIVFPFLLHYYHLFHKNNLMQVNEISFSWDYYSCYIYSTSRQNKCQNQSENRPITV